MAPTPIYEPVSDCPFCSIASCYPPFSPLSPASNDSGDQSQPFRTAYVILSTPHVIAFLDIMPLTRGHALLVPRRHAAKMGDLTPEEGAELGRILPLLARSVISAVLQDIPVEEADYNIVQNNGHGAAQVVPHVHFHIIPRPPLDYPSASSLETKLSPPRSQMQFFGRGQRTDLVEDEAEELIKAMREKVAEEWRKTFPGEKEMSGGKTKL